MVCLVMFHGPTILTCSSSESVWAAVSAVPVSCCSVTQRRWVRTGSLGRSDWPYQLRWPETPGSDGQGYPIGRRWTEACRWSNWQWCCRGISSDDFDMHDNTDNEKNLTITDLRVLITMLVVPQHSILSHINGIWCTGYSWKWSDIT